MPTQQYIPLDAEKRVRQYIGDILKKEIDVNFAPNVLEEYHEFLRQNHQYLLDEFKTGYPHVGIQKDICTIVTSWLALSYIDVKSRVESLEESMTIIMNQLEYDKADREELREEFNMQAQEAEEDEVVEEDDTTSYSNHPTGIGRRIQY